MTTDGGGWTGIDFPTSYASLHGTMTALDSTGVEGIDVTYGPYTQDGGDNHMYLYEFDFLPGIMEFYLSDWSIKANSGGNAVSEYGYWSFTSWTAPNFSLCGEGDVIFGGNTAPVISYGDTVNQNTCLGNGAQSCYDCVTPWPLGTDIFPMTTNEYGFTVGWAEGGGESEGWYPWYTGTVYLR